MNNIDSDDVLSCFLSPAPRLSDLELVGRQNGQVSVERNVQFASPVSVDVDAEGSEEVFLQEIDDFIAAGSKEDYARAYSKLRQNERKVIFHYLLSLPA